MEKITRWRQRVPSVGRLSTVAWPINVYVISNKISHLLPRNGILFCENQYCFNVRSKNSDVRGLGFYFDMIIMRKRSKDEARNREGRERVFILHWRVGPYLREKKKSKVPSFILPSSGVLKYLFDFAFDFNCLIIWFWIWKTLYRISVLFIPDKLTTF